MKKLLKYILKAMKILALIIVILAAISWIFIKVNYRYKLYIIQNAYENHSDEIVQLCELMNDLVDRSNMRGLTGWSRDEGTAYTKNGISVKFKSDNYYEFEPYRSIIQSVFKRLDSLSVKRIYGYDAKYCRLVFFGGGVLGSDFGIYYNKENYALKNSSFHLLERMDDKGEWYFFID